MRLRWIALAVATALAPTTGWAPSTALGAPRPICGPSDRTKTIDATSMLRVFTRRPNVSMFVCRRDTPQIYRLSVAGGSWLLGSDFGGRAGRFVVIYETTAADVGSGDATQTYIVDTRSGRYVEAGGAYLGAGFDQTQISREGSVVWLDTGFADDGAPTSVVVTLGRDGRQRPLDAGPAASDLRLRGRVVTWLQAGQPRTATLSGPPRYSMRLRTVRFRS